MRRNYLRRIFILMGLLAIIFSVAVAGYILIADYSFIDALFMATITISTVGFEVVGPLSTEAKVFTIFLIFSSISVFAGILSYISRYFFDGNFRKHLIQMKMETKIKKLKNHIIICGYGRNGKAAVRELEENGEKFVIVEDNPDRIAYLQENTNFVYVKGNATNIDVLTKLNIENAKALILALPSDSDNLFILLSARKINRGLRVIARVSKPESEEIFRTAGANHIIMPDKLGGKQMASLVTHENVIEFVEYLLMQSADDVVLKPIFINKRKKNFKDISLKQVYRSNVSGANIVGVKDVFNNFIYNPTEEALLVEQQYLYVLGTQEEIEELTRIIYSIDAI